MVQAQNKMSILEQENKLKLPLHLLNNGGNSQKMHNSTTGTNRSTKSNRLFLGNHSNRTGEHLSSYNTAEFTYEEKEDNMKRSEIRYNKLAEIVSQKDNNIKPDKKTLEILNYYNRSMNSEASNENSKENKMLKDALYATIKLVLDQNKQIKKLKEAVTHRKVEERNSRTSGL